MWSEESYFCIKVQAESDWEAEEIAGSGYPKHLDDAIAVVEENNRDFVDEADKHGLPLTDPTLKWDMDVGEWEEDEYDIRRRLRAVGTCLGYVNETMPEEKITYYVWEEQEWDE